MGNFTLYEARTRKGLSQKQIAKHIGVDHSYYSRLESGKTPLKKPEWLNKLHDILEIDNAFKEASWTTENF